MLTALLDIRWMNSAHPVPIQSIWIDTDAFLNSKWEKTNGKRVIILLLIVKKKRQPRQQLIIISNIRNSICFTHIYGLNIYYGIIFWMVKLKKKKICSVLLSRKIGKYWRKLTNLLLNTQHKSIELRWAIVEIIHDNLEFAFSLMPYKFVVLSGYFNMLNWTMLIDDIHIIKIQMEIRTAKKNYRYIEMQRYVLCLQPLRPIRCCQVEPTAHATTNGIKIKQISA